MQMPSVRKTFNVENNKQNIHTLSILAKSMKTEKWVPYQTSKRNELWEEMETGCHEIGFGRQKDGGTHGDKKTKEKEAYNFLPMMTSTSDDVHHQIKWHPWSSRVLYQPQP
ncbi:hypothetical protein V8G54_031704 [Vigna mungo]|uniref:Uncharacterized protein n=1 Tax=Vigna mungo TaxID=3915 RepID=A0AAQ3MKI5_VIGMU